MERRSGIARVIDVLSEKGELGEKFETWKRLDDLERQIISKWISLGLREIVRG